MKKTIISNITKKIGFTAVFTLIILAASVFGQKDDGKSDFFWDISDISTQPVIVMATGEKVPAAGATMTRNNQSVFFTLHTQGLTPGNVVTAWMAVFNNPRHCATSPCTPADFANPDVNGTLLNTGGRIIGPDGSATYGAFRAVGDVTGARPGVGTGNGLVRPRRAEIHIVLRSHGPASADPAILAEQLSMFNGGCPPNVCSNFGSAIFMQ
ncbi:MAG: hypothetical protein ACRD6X_05895 [Pyrinomonadaceae bacterium]